MRQRQEDLWYGGELPAAPGHPFYKRLNEVLDNAKFDRLCEKSCAGFYHQKLGRPSLPPGQYFRIMMIGFFEGLDSERGIAWRLADSLTLRQFLSIGLDEKTPDHVTISRTRRLINAATHQRIFSFVLEQLAQAGLIKGKTIGVDSTTLEANAAMKSIVRRDTGESYMATRSRYRGHRFLPEIIGYAVWVYHRFCLRFRDVEDLLAERGILVSHEAIRQWCSKFGPDYARRLKKKQGRMRYRLSAARNTLGYACRPIARVKAVKHSGYLQSYCSRPDCDH